MNNQSLTKTLCQSRTDANSNPCEWCSLSQNPFLPGACLSQSQKEAAGQFCSSSDTTNCVSIIDETTCTATIDTTASPDQNCVFCTFRFVGGKCVTNTLAESFAQFCAQKGDDEGRDIFLRGNIAGGWRTLDPSCLSDNTDNEADEDCGSKTDLNGDSCIWCDAAGIFGECVSRSQKEFFEDYLKCADNDVNVIAVEK